MTNPTDPPGSDDDAMDWGKYGVVLTAVLTLGILALNAAQNLAGPVWGIKDNIANIIDESSGEAVSVTEGDGL